MLGLDGLKVVIVFSQVMTPAEKEKITDLKKCNFRDMCEFFKAESEKRKNRTKEEKKVSLSSR